MSVLGDLAVLKSTISESDSAHHALSACIENGCYVAHNSRGNKKPVSVVRNKANRVPTNTPVYVHDYYDTILDAVTGISYRSNALFAYAFDGLANIPNNMYLVLPKSDCNMMAVNGVNDFYVTFKDTLIPQAAKASVRLLCDMYSERSSQRVYSVHVLENALQEGFEKLYRETNMPDMLNSTNMVELVGYSTLVVADPLLANVLNSESFKRGFINKMYDSIDALVRSADDSVKFDDLKSVASRHDEVHMNSEEFILIKMSLLRKAQVVGQFYTVKDVLKQLL